MDLFVYVIVVHVACTQDKNVLLSPLKNKKFWGLHLKGFPRDELGAVIYYFKFMALIICRYDASLKVVIGSVIARCHQTPGFNLLLAGQLAAPPH